MNQPDRARAFVMHAKGRGGIEEFDFPEIDEDSGLLRMECAGVCGTDLKIWDGRFGAVSLPLIPGHEICGIVEQLGARAVERWNIAVGDRVAVDSFLVCGACDACLHGQGRYCETMGDYGVSMGASRPPHLWGGFAEYVYLAPGAQLYRLPDGISAEMGILIPAVISNAIRWVEDIGRVGMGSSVLIVGPGPIGLAGVAVARAVGAANVIVSGLETDERRFAMARRLGADAVLTSGPDLREQVLELTGGQGVDTVVDVSGSAASLSAAAGLVRRQGRVVAGGLGGGSAELRMPIDDFILREITLHGVFSHDRASIQRAIRFVERSDAPFADFVTHRFALADTPRAIELVGQRDPGLIKAVVEPFAKAA